MKRVVAALLAAQVALVGVYLAVEGSRAPETPFRWERLDEPAPELRATRDDRAVPAPTGPHLVHFWATWCAPCVEELPALLEAADDEGVPLLAVTDEPWPVVARWFDGEVPAAIAQADALGAWRVSGLPDTFGVADGRIVARMGGPRAWDTAEARAFLRSLRGRSTSASGP